MTNMENQIKVIKIDNFYIVIRRFEFINSNLLSLK